MCQCAANYQGKYCDDKITYSESLGIRLSDHLSQWKLHRRTARHGQVLQDLLCSQLLRLHFV